MSRLVVRGLLLACVAALLLSVPAPSYGCKCLDGLCPCNWFGGGSATTYAPPYSPVTTVAPTFTPASACVCDPCAAQTCCYVPQTCYRTVCRVVPVTTCQAFGCCDPCTGCPVTCYRPVTTYQRCAQLIPYTTYRMVWSNPCVSACVPCATCAPCATSCGIGCSASYLGPAVLGSSGSTTSYVGPAAPLQSVPSSGSTPSTFVAPPSPSPTPASGTPAQELRKEDKPVIDLPIRPIPESDTQPSSLERSKSVDPANRTAARPIRRHVGYVTASRTGPLGTTSTGPVDFGGWRSSRD